MGSDWVNACSELLVAATRLQEQLPPATRLALAPLLAHMNCYYSNLIEGHRTYPGEVEQAVQSGTARATATDQQRMLVHEAVAHIHAQSEIRARLRTDPAWEPVAAESLAWMHQVFYGHLPAEFRWTATKSGSQRIAIVPGAWRDQPVVVGEHIPPEVASLPEFLARFTEAYRGCTKPNPASIASIAASHHRFAWVHPFVDGNGRVARLLTDALVERSCLGADGLWCVGRGFARSLDRYRTLLAGADRGREHDTDGRGPRTQAGLDRWCAYVLEVMLDQVRFMHGLIRPADLRERIMTWAEREAAQGRLHPRAGRLIAEVVTTGSVNRTEAVDILRLTDRYGREQIRILIQQGLVAASEREPLRPAFPLKTVPWWFPGLFPGDVEQQLNQL
ncbi:MAG: Fic family protein [Planctomycetes bacterium]|nr:Fic family protein [Planctomycetota bacterium]